MTLMNIELNDALIWAMEHWPLGVVALVVLVVLIWRLGGNKVVAKAKNGGISISAGGNVNNVQFK